MTRLPRCAICGSTVFVERFSDPRESGTRYTCLLGAHEVEVLDERHQQDLDERLAQRRGVGVAV